MSAIRPVPRVLQIFGSLSASDPQARRAVRLANAFGPRLRHTFISSEDDRGALHGLDRKVQIEVANAFPQISGLPTPGRLQAIARSMVDYNLVLTHGRAGTMAALAHTTFSDLHALPPLIHHEDGSDETTKDRKGLRSKWSRRVGLGKAVGLVVPTDYMEAVALVDWQQPLGRVKLIRDGVAPGTAKATARSKGLPRLLKRQGEHWIGCFTGFGPDESLTPLVDAMALLDDDWHLVLIGEGSGRATVAERVTAGRIDHRVHILPAATRAEALSAFDILAVVQNREPLPVLVIEAMMAGLPVCGFESGEVADALSGENADLIRPRSDAEGFKQSLLRLSDDPSFRKAVGAANRARAEAERGETAMIASYRRLYASAMKVDLS